MNAPYSALLLQRTLAAAYQFHDIFFEPLDDRSPPVLSLLDVSIPSLGWSAFRAEGDATYRFSALTVAAPAPSGTNLAVQVMAPRGDYVNLEPILLTLPRALSSPPKRSDFLITKPLWPTTALRPPDGETAVRGQIRSGTSATVSDIKVEMWTGVAPAPSAGAPYTRSNADGDFLFRFPLVRRSTGSTITVNIRLAGGAITVSPASTPVVFGRTQIIQFQMT